MLRTRSCIAAGIVCGLGTSAALAGGVFTGFRIEVSAGESEYWNSDDAPGSINVSQNPDGSFKVTGNFTGSLWSGAWDLTVDPDPRISGTFDFTSMSSMPDVFEVLLTLPVSPLPAPTQMSGSIALSVRDNVLDTVPATVTSEPGGAIYSALIDGAPVRSLLPDPFRGVSSRNPSQQDPFSGDVVSSTAPNQTSTLFGVDRFRDETGPGVVAEIGIRHRFSLTGGDSLRVWTTFQVVPEPITLALLAMGTLALVRRKKR